MAAPSWLHRVEEDEMRTLLRASANYARQGYDPALATLQNKGKTRAAKRGSSLAAKAKFENNFLGTVPTHYRSVATGRSLTTVLPAVRPSSRSVRAPTPASTELVKAQGTQASRLEQAASRGGRRNARAEEEALLEAAGVGKASDAVAPVHPSRLPLSRLGPQLNLVPVEDQLVSLAALPASVRAGASADLAFAGGLGWVDQGDAQDPARSVPRPSDVLKRYTLFAVRDEDKGAGPRLVGLMPGGGAGRDVAATPLPPGVAVSEGRAALAASRTTAVDAFSGPGPLLRASAPGMPPGAASHAILQNRLGRAEVTPMPLPRGGSGLVVGDLLVSHSQLLPASLTAAKWGRLAHTTYSSSPAHPCRLSIELQPLYYESLLMDLHTVLDGTGGFVFEALVAPGAFLVDVGLVNATVHGLARPADLESKAGRAIMVPQGTYVPPPPSRGGEVPAPEEGCVEGAAPRAMGVFGLGDIASAKAGNKKELVEDAARASRRRQAARDRAAKPPKPITAEDVQRAELAVAIEATKEAAAKLIMKLALDGNDNALEVLLTEGVRVKWDPIPVFVKASIINKAAKVAARARTFEGEVQEGEQPPPPSNTAGYSAAARPPTPTDQESLDPPAPAPAAGKPAFKPVYVKPLVNAADEVGNTPLMLACRGGWIDAALVLLRNGADHKRRNHAGQSALDLSRAESATASIALHVNIPGAAARKRRAAKLASLLDDRTVLVCAQKGDARRLEYLVDECEHPVDAANAYGMTPLHFAVLRRDPGIAAFLTKRGADVSARNNLGQSPLSLVLDMPSSDLAQARLLKALNAGEETNVGDILEARLAHEESLRQEYAETALVRQLKTYTKGTSAAVAVYSALGHVGKAGSRADFGAHGMVGAGAKEATRDSTRPPALTKSIGLNLDPHALQGGAPGPLSAAPLTRAEKVASLTHPLALADSWSRHMVQYIAQVEKNARSGNAAAHRREAEAEDVARAEIRAGRLAPGAAAEAFIKSRSSGAPVGRQGLGVGVDSPAGMLKADATGVLDAVQVPPADSARFETWARMRFGF
jgi:ankyrin repeat protein